MTVKVDVSEISIVVYCTDCASWGELAFDVAEGHRIAVDHEGRLHPNSRVAYTNQYKWQKRRNAA
ncbi:MAG: hypothetical protein JWP85_986 [Rhodoglobus sp.]|nr:hypothetical protein [Rhodoglobus sp.]